MVYMVEPENDTKINIEITITNWRWLNGLKGPGDSFNSVITRLKESSKEATKRIDKK